MALYERSGVVVLENEGTIDHGSSGRIEIHGSACGHVSFTTPEEHIQADIDRMRILYGPFRPGGSRSESLA